MAIYVDVEIKWCKLCETYKNIEEFSTDKSRSDNRFWACKSCDKHRKRFILYKLTQAEFYALLLKQDSKCAICNNKLDLESPKKISVDHDHETGNVRGILCTMCNRILGMLGDSIEQVDNFAEGVRGYLR